MLSRWRILILWGSLLCVLRRGGRLTRGGTGWMGGWMNEWGGWMDGCSCQLVTLCKPDHESKALLHRVSNPIYIPLFFCNFVNK